MSYPILLQDVTPRSQEIRKYMRQMGTASGVPIEPPEQSRLLDACLSKPGVVAGGVPGGKFCIFRKALISYINRIAGGYDAVWLLVLEIPGTKISPVILVEEVWSSWTELNVSPLSAAESREQGARVEHLEDIPGLKDILKEI